MTKKEILRSLLTQAENEEKKFMTEFEKRESNTIGKIDQWSAKDIVAHNTYWKLYCVENAQAFLRKEDTAACDDVDKINAEVFEENKNKTWQEVSGKLQSVNRYAMECLAMISDNLMDSDTSAWQRGKPLCRMIAGSCYLHPVAHMAEYYSKQGNNGDAIQMFERAFASSGGLSDSPEWLGVIHYNLACGYAICGKYEKAVAELGKALEQDPGLTEWSKEDPDLDSIRKHEGYKALYTAGN
jgi:tetratricopeptide (TPR) repeat protein